MKKLALLLALIATPAQAAEWLVQQPGDTAPTMVVTKNTQPIAGQDVPTGSQVAPFVPQSGDTYPGNYRIDAGNNVTYQPPTPPAPPVQDPNAPKLADFETAVFADNTIPLEARMALADKYPLLDKYITLNPTALIQYWGGLKAGAGTSYPWLTQAVISAVEAHAVTFHIPLVP